MAELPDDRELELAGCDVGCFVILAFWVFASIVAATITHRLW